MTTIANPNFMNLEDTRLHELTDAELSDLAEWWTEQHHAAGFTDYPSLKSAINEERAWCETVAGWKARVSENINQPVQ